MSDEIETVTEVKRGPGRPPNSAKAVAAEPAVPKTFRVRLKYDTWIGETRISCQGGNAIVDLPFDLAIDLMSIGKAERADPIPGAD